MEECFMMTCNDYILTHSYDSYNNEAIPAWARDEGIRDYSSFLEKVSSHPILNFLHKLMRA